MAPGETDRLSFNFAFDAGAADIVGASWTLSLQSGVGLDPSPQSHVLGVTIERSIDLRSPLDNCLYPRRGAYVTALIGGLPDSALGAIYLHTAFANLSDGRRLMLSTTMLCG
jgi:hypothetical protein